MIKSQVQFGPFDTLPICNTICNIYAYCISQVCTRYIVDPDKKSKQRKLRPGIGVQAISS